MKLRSLVVAVAAFAMAGSALAQDVSSEKGKLSYYFGYDYGNNLAELTARGEQLDINSVVKGLQDAYAKQKPALTAEQLKPALEAFQKREQARAQSAASASGFPPAAVSEAWAAAAEAYRSRQPRCPQGQSVPPGRTTTWPISPAKPCAPDSTRPSIPIAPAMPVPCGTNRKRSAPRPAPIRRVRQTERRTGIPLDAAVTPTDDYEILSAAELDDISQARR